MASANKTKQGLLIGEYQELSTRGIQKARECIDFLKFSEGLVRRDIDLIRMQLEIKLKKLESRLQAELRNIVETETTKLERFIADQKSINYSNKDNLSHERLATLKASLSRMERKRLKFEANTVLEKSLDEIKSFGRIVVEKIDSEKSNSVSQLNKTKGKTELPNGYKRTQSDSSTELTSRLESASNKVQQKNAQRHTSLSDSSDISSEPGDNTKGVNCLKSVCEKTATNRTIDNGIPNKTTETVNNNCQSRVELDKQPLVKDTKRTACIDVEGKNDKDGSDWMHADPMSVLRALKQQTSRTEENLKALRDVKSDNSTGSDANKTNGCQILKTRSGATLTTSNVISKTNKMKNSEGETNSHNTIDINKTIQRGVNGHDIEDDEFENMDKVTRANELWFGRDRRSRCEDFKYRRTRSLSPKSVRFKFNDSLRDEIQQRNDASTKQGTDVRNTNRPSGYKHFPVTKKGDNRPEKTDIDRNHTNSSLKEEHKGKCNDLSKLSNRLTVDKADPRLDIHKRENAYRGLSYKASEDSFAQHRKQGFSNSTSNGNSDLNAGNQLNENVGRGKEQENGRHSKIDAFNNELGNNITNSESKGRACISSRQKLRDKRRRNNTISVITPSDIAKLCLKVNTEDTTDNVFMEMKNAKDARAHGSSTCNTPDTNCRIGNQYTSTNGFKMQQPIPVLSIQRPRMLSEDSCLSLDNTKNDSGNDSDLLTRLVSHNLQSAKAAKTKYDRQKLPSFREMLFSD